MSPDRIPGEIDRQPVDLVSGPGGLTLERPGAAPLPLSPRAVVLRLELLRVVVELVGPEGEQLLRFSAADATRVEAALRGAVPPSALELRHSLAGFLARELRVALDADEALALVRAAGLPEAGVEGAARVRRRLAAWALGWGLALPAALTLAGVLALVLPRGQDPAALALGSLVAFAAFNLLATLGLVVQGLLQPRVAPWLER